MPKGYKTKPSDRIKWQDKKKADGLCWACGKNPALSPGKHSRCKSCSKKVSIWWQRRSRQLREEMIHAYGSRCNCCGETEPRFLTLEHKNGGGHRWRREHTKSTTSLLMTLAKLGWPKDEFTILCWNCNCSTKDGLPCPHKEKDLRNVG